LEVERREVRVEEERGLSDGRNANEGVERDKKTIGRIKERFWGE